MARIPTRKRPFRLAFAAALVAVGCSGGSGGCGSSCGGAFRTKDDQGNPIVFTGTRLANVAQVRITKSGLAFLNAEHLNDVIAQLNNAAGGLQIKCIDAGVLVNACGILGFIDITRVHLLAGDEQLTGDPARCTGDPAHGIAQEPGTPLHIQFKDVSWSVDPVNSVLHAHLVMHLKTGDMYLRTVEEHSSLCGGTSAIQARVKYDDLLPGLPPQDQYTAADLSIRFSTAPDGRLELNFDDASLANFVDNFHPAALVLDGNVGNDPTPPGSAAYNGDGCDSGTGTYSTMDSATSLRCAGVFDAVNAGCDVTQQDGGVCAIVQYVRGVLFDTIKNSFRTQIVTVLRKQLDNIRCQRSTDSQGSAVACDATHACPNDDDGNALVCDASRGVCKPQNDSSTDPYDCEPISLGVSGQLDVSGLTSKVGFAPGTKLNVFAALGSKGGGARIDSNGLQLAAEAGTQVPSVEIAPCVPSASPPADIAVPPMDFDDASNKPPAVVNYDFGFSLASAMLNRGFYDAYDAGMLCIAITNVTSSFISSGLFKTFLPSIGLVTGGRDVPMKILLRPTLPPFVRVGKNTTKTDANGNDIPDDPLITLSFDKMNLDFYALVDERQVRIFTLQADLKLPLDLRPDPNDNSSLVPVMGGLDTVLANISALSPDYNPDATATNGKPAQLPYSPGSDMLAEDPGVVKDLLGAAVRLAQPLLAGVIKPIALPSMFGLKFEVRGVAGAVPTADVVNDGFHHLAIWAQVGVCGTTGVNCERYSVRTEARVVEKYLPASLREVQAGARPSITLDLSARTAASARAQFTYRVDGSLWSAWLSQQRLTITDPLFLVQGHHTIEVAAREAGDDSTADRRPVAIDFFVSYEAPTVTLTQRPDDGALVTRAHSASTPASRLTYSYRIDGQQGWTEPGPARVFTQDELNGHGLTVSVTDDAGHSAQAHFGEEEGLVLARAGAGGCASSGAGIWTLLGLLALVARRQRKGSISVG
jgi:MYXO-CTERM domain-containing protein